MTKILIIASSCQNRLASWRQGFNGFVCTTIETSSLETLLNNVVRIKPEILLLDYDLLGSEGVAGLKSICTETKTIIAGGGISKEKEWELLKTGIRGCCRHDVPHEFLRQVVMAVQDGELWIRRTLICRLVDELGKAAANNISHQSSFSLLNKLTQREHDIAAQVKNGESNKQIAKTCSITERTVKSHLTEIFQKLGVTDRLNLALVMSADDRRKGVNHRTPEIRRTPVTRKDDAPDILEFARITAH